MDFAVVVIVEILYAVASLALIAAGLAVVFGMMRVINLAHGEFLMLGGYTAIVSVKAGINIYVAMLVVAPIVVGAIGGSRVNAEAVAEREALIQRREAAERVLGNLKRMAGVGSPNTRADASMVTIAAF